MFNGLFATRGLSLERLKTFVEVAAHGGIAKAVPDDPVRQSQFSRQIKEIETFFEVELLRRKGKGMELTPAGRELMRLVQAHFTALDDFRLQCISEPVALKLGAGDSLLQWLVIPHAGTIQRELGSVKLDLLNLKTDEAIERVQDHSLDFAIIRKEAIPASLHRQDLGNVTYSLFVPSKLKTCKFNPDLAWILQNLPIASGSSTGYLWRDLSQWAQNHGFQVRIQLQCESFPQAAAAVRTGDYVAILPDAMQAELDPEHVHRFDGSAFRASKRSLALCWHPKTELVRPTVANAANTLIRHLKGALKKVV